MPRAPINSAADFRAFRPGTSGADGGILREESRDGFLYEVFGDLAAVASVALDIPDPELL